MRKIISQIAINGRLDKQSIHLPLLTPVVPPSAALLPYLERIDSARQYTNFGPLVIELEARLLRILQSHTRHPLHLVTVSSATLGLELALSALDLPAGSRILVPALTFVASMTSILRAGHIPVITDVDSASWLVTPDLAEHAAKASGAKAVLVVAAFGRSVDSAAWSAFQHATGIRVVIDAAGAYGSQWVDATDITVVYSMHATKSLAAGEGGLVVSGHAVTTHRIRQMSNFGINLGAVDDVPLGQLVWAGTNAKLSEFHAAVGLASLDMWEEQASTQHHLYLRYQSSLEARSPSALTWQAGPIPASPTLFCVRLGSAKRRDILEHLCAEAGIATRRWYQPLLHKHEALADHIYPLPVPEAEKIAADLLGLPFFSDMTEAQIELVSHTVYSAVTQ